MSGGAQQTGPKMADFSWMEESIAKQFIIDGLIDAARTGDLDSVKAHINGKVGINGKFSWDGMTALHWSCRKGHTKVVKYLINNNADISLTTNDGWTALHYACRYGYIEVVKHLVNNKADISAATNDGMTALHLACRDGHTEVVKHLINNNADISATDNNDWTALHYACSNGHTEIVKYLLTKRVKLLVPNKDGKTPLQLAKEATNVKKEVRLEITELLESYLQKKQQQQQQQQQQPNIVQSQVHRRNSEGAYQQCQRKLPQLKAENQQVHRERERLLKEKDLTIQHLQQNNSNLTTQNQLLQQNNSQLSTQTKEFRQQNECYRSQNQSLQERVEEQTMQLQQLTVEKEQYQQQIGKLRQQNEHYKSQNQSLQQQVEQQTRQLQVEKQQYQQQIGELRQQKEYYKSQSQTPTWVVNRTEINLSDKELGRGAYGCVKEATFRGSKVAVKCLHNDLISDYNLHIFDREMTMAARSRHPNLLQFIGATNEGVPLIVTEIMHTSLRKNLERGEVSSEQIISISIGVARGLNYLHKTTPSPILHRDVSSANVLLNPLPSNQWLAKLSDFGSFNFMRESRTMNAGNPVYAAPEALDSSKGDHSPAMDVYSFGVLMHEMCSRRLPTRGLTPAIVKVVDWKMPESSLVPLICSCVEECILKRPKMDYLITELNRLQ